ncbi:MAG: histidine kinase [Oscillospiraceae bacterium]
MKKNNAINLGFLFAVLAVISVSIYAAGAYQKIKPQEESTAIDFSDGWTYSEVSDPTDSQTPKKEDNSVKKRYILSKKLPDMLPQDAIMHLQINHNAVKAYVSGVRIPVEGVLEDGVFGIRYPELYATVSLKQAYAGHLITLDVEDESGNSGIDIGNIRIISRNELTVSFVKEKTVQCILFVMLVTIAVLLFAAEIKFHGQYSDIGEDTFRYLKWFILIAAIWVLFDSKILGVIYGYNDFQYLASFYSFMLMPIPMALFIGEMFDNKNRIFKIIAWLLIANVLLNIVLLMFGVIHSLSQTLPIVHVLIIVLACVTFYMSIYNYVKYESPGTHEMIIGMLLFAMMALIALILFYFGKSDYYSLAFAAGQLLLIIFLSLGVIKKMISVTKFAMKSEENEMKSLKAQNSLLVSQINTHFFYHVLSSIRTLIKVDPDAAYKMLGDFSKYLRYKTDSNSQKNDLVKFSDELKQIKTYADLKKVLLGDRLKVIYEIETSDFYIPVLSVQPLVENAIKHGIEKKQNGGTVRISVGDEKDFYKVTVEDDGVGFDTKLVKDREAISVSQNNIKERLSYYGDNNIKIVSTPNKGTRVTLTFVKEMKPDADDGIS